MASDAEILLVEMRDYLAEIAEALRPQFRASVNARLGKQATELRRVAGDSARRWHALAMMDGEKSQADIARVASMDRSDLSKFVKGMQALGVVEAGGRQPPRCNLTQAELEAVRYGTD